MAIRGISNDYVSLRVTHNNHEGVITWGLTDAYFEIVNSKFKTKCTSSHY
jgi:hypothetical protein